MGTEVFFGLSIPFIGTAAGSACVFFMRKKLGERLQRALTGFTAGVMVAASIWSLIIPAMEQSSEMGKWSWAPAVAGFWFGILFLLLLDTVIPEMSAGEHSNIGVVMFAVGFTLMMALDVALG